MYKPSRRGLLRTIGAGATIAFAALIAAAPAFADNVQNELTAVGGDTITAGATTTVNYKIAANNGNRQDGCNAADTSPATVTIVTPVGVSATPASLTFTSCESSKPVVFTSSAVGRHDIGVTVADAGAGTYNTNPAKFTLVVNAAVPPAASTVTSPVLTLPSAITAEATSSSGAAVNFATSADDESDDTLAVDCSHVSGDTFPLGTTTVNCEATNAADTTKGSFTITVSDTTAPLITVHSMTGTYVGETFTWIASTSDAVDGAGTATCNPGSGVTPGPGSTQVSCSATDAAGNTATKSFCIHATYSWSGVLQPVNADGSSSFKINSTIPVKFRLTGPSAGIATANATIRLVKVDSSADGTAAETTSTATPTTGTTFRYDAAGDQYIYNLATKALSSGDYKVMINLHDGANERASQQFSLRK